MFDTYDFEEIILGMANLVIECRNLRREVKRLKEFEEKYYEAVNARFKDAQQHSINMLEAVLAMAEKEELK